MIKSTLHPLNKTLLATIVMFFLFNSVRAADTLDIKIHGVSPEIYELVVTNVSDKVIGFIYSWMTHLYVGDTVELVPDGGNMYTLIKTIDDNIDGALPIYNGECIMPSQSKIIFIKLNEMSRKNIFTFFYFEKNDYCHEKFLKETTKRNWSRKYKINRIQLIIPD